MHRTLAAAALLLSAACGVERTPPEYNSHREAGEQEASEALKEVEARVGAFRESLSRGDELGAAGALAPSADAVVMGPGADSVAGEGEDAVVAAIRSLGEAAGARTPDLRVKVNAREKVGWFSTHLELRPDSAGPRRMRMTGVYARVEEGGWRLVQLHLSRATLPPAPPRPDSLAPSRDSMPSPAPAGG